MLIQPPMAQRQRVPIDTATKRVEVDASLQNATWLSISFSSVLNMNDDTYLFIYFQWLLYLGHNHNVFWSLSLEYWTRGGNIDWVGCQTIGHKHTCIHTHIDVALSVYLPGKGKPTQIQDEHAKHHTAQWTELRIGPGTTCHQKYRDNLILFHLGISYVTVLIIILKLGRILKAIF